MLRILRRLKHAFELLPIIALLMICAACRNSSSHCYLCQSVPYNEPCIINLATGEIAVLSTGGYGHAELSMIGGVSVTGINGESCRATIPANGAEMNPALFCEDCRELIEAAPNSGYALADLRDLDNIKLYSIEAGNSFTIRGHSIQIEAGADGERIVTVTGKE